jgi:hypothetical protein
MPLAYDDIPGSWGVYSANWPSIHDPNGEARALGIKTGIVPYGAYVTVGDQLRLETPEYVAKVRSALHAATSPPTAPDPREADRRDAERGG